MLAKPGLACYVRTHKGVVGLCIDRLGGWKMMKYGNNELEKPGNLNIRWMCLYNSVPPPPSEKKSEIITSMKRIDGPSSPFLTCSSAIVVPANKVPYVESAPIRGTNPSSDRLQKVLQAQIHLEVPLLGSP